MSRLHKGRLEWAAVYVDGDMIDEYIKILKQRKKNDSKLCGEKSLKRHLLLNYNEMIVVLERHKHKVNKLESTCAELTNDLNEIGLKHVELTDEVKILKDKLKSIRLLCEVHSKHSFRKESMTIIDIQAIEAVQDALGRQIIELIDND